MTLDAKFVLPQADTDRHVAVRIGSQLSTFKNGIASGC